MVAIHLPKGPQGDDWHGSRRRPSFYLSHQSDRSCLSPWYTTFRSIPASSDKEIRSPNLYKCHYSHMDSTNIRPTLNTDQENLCSTSFSRSLTFVTSGSGETLIALTRKTIRCIRNASAMIITNTSRTACSRSMSRSRGAVRKRSLTLRRSQPVERTYEDGDEEDEDGRWHHSAVRKDK